MKTIQRLLQLPWAGPLIALLVVYGVFAAVNPDTMLRAITLETIVRQTVVVGLCSVGMTLVIISGGIDLSIGSIVAMVTVVVASALKSGQSVLMAVLLGVGVGLACGALNGALVAGLKIMPFLVTLSTMSIVRGLAKGEANQQKIDVEAQGLDALLMGAVPAGSLRLIPTGAWITLALAGGAAIMLRYTRFGRHLVAVGSSPNTARLCGISISRVTIAAYAIAGLLAGVAGIMEFATLTVGDPTDSIGLELKVIAAVTIGGASLTGGRGSIAGSLLGATLMVVIAAGASHMGIENWVQEILTGVIILVAVTVDRLRRGEIA